MNKKSVSTILAVAFSVGGAHAASNFLPVVPTESVTFPGPLAHAGDPGDPDNSITSHTFTGGFQAATVTFEGTLDQTGGIAATWASEANVGLTDPLGNPTIGVGSGGGQVYTPPLPFSGNGAFPSPVDVAGEWTFEFFESYDDGPGPDQFSSGVTITFSGANDSPSSESMGVFTLGDTANSIGEFGLGGLLDTYTVNLADGGIFTVGTSPDATGAVGAPADTEVAFFDSAGVLIGTNDDGGPFGGGTGAGDFFSELSLALPAGDFTVLVGSWDTNFEDLTPGTSTIGDVVGGVDGGSLGDYAISFALQPIPEPSAVSLLLLGLAGVALRRRR